MTLPGSPNQFRYSLTGSVRPFLSEADTDTIPRPAVLQGAGPGPCGATVMSLKHQRR